jgi:uncharacterized membrane protein YgcG
MTARLLASLSVLALLTSGCSSVSMTDATAYLNDHYNDAGLRWTSTSPANVVADDLDTNLRADDVTYQSGNHYLRGDDWLIAISTTAAGALIELSDYDTGYRRHRTHLGSYWGSTPGSYGPRSSTGGGGGGWFGGFRGGGGGFGK